MGINIGCLLDAAAISDGVLRDLVSRFNVNALFVRGAVSLSSVKAKVVSTSPDGAAPGFWFSADDSALQRAIDGARAAGIDPYVVVSNPFVGRPEWTDFLAVDSGGRTASNVNRDAPVLCPNRPKLLKWLPAAVAEATKVYKPAGVLLDDFSIGSVGSTDAIFMCWCDQCQTRMGELGYDVDKIRTGLQGARSKLGEAGSRLNGLHDVGLAQFIEAIGYDTGLLDWLNFRADAVSACLYEIRQAISSVDRGLRVAILHRSPTVAILAGQRRMDVIRDPMLADIYIPVLSGPAAGVLATIAAHAALIRHSGGSVSEAEALAFSMALHGYSCAPLPASIDELATSLSAEILVASFERELRLSMSVRGTVPQWPAIDTTGQSADSVAAAVNRIRETTAEGLVFLGVPK